MGERFRQLLRSVFVLEEGCAPEFIDRVQDILEAQVDQFFLHLGQQIQSEFKDYLETMEYELIPKS